MLNNVLLQNSYLGLIIIVFILSIIALAAELLPEVEAKIIVIPTLILIIILCIVEIKKNFFYKKNNIKKF